MRGYAKHAHPTRNPYQEAELTTTTPQAAEYRPAWATEWTPCTIVGEIPPAGRIGRFFGATHPVSVITLPGDAAPFATQTRNLRYA